MANIVQLAPLETIQNSELVDYTIPNTSITKSIKETINNSDNIYFYKMKYKSILETINNTEKTIYVFAWQFDTIKTIDIVEQVYKQLDINRTQKTTENIKELVKYIKQQHRHNIDTIQNTETVAYTIPKTSIIKPFVKTVNIVDVTSKSLIRTRKENEPVNITDTVDHFVNTSPVAKSLAAEIENLVELPPKVLKSKFKSLSEQESLLEIVEKALKYNPSISTTINISDLVSYNINSSVFVKQSNRITRIREAINKNILSFIKATLEAFRIVETGSVKKQTLISMPTANSFNYALNKYKRQFTTHSYTVLKGEEALYTVENIQNDGVPFIHILYSHNQLRLHPGNIYFSFGLIAKDTAQEFTIKSGYTQDLTVTAITLPSYIGGVVALNVGDIIPALSDISFIFTLFLDKGVVVLDNANFSIELNNSIIIPIYISATRQTGIVNSFEPDYKTYKESIQYSTKTFRTMNGVEKRKSLLLFPKRRIEYNRTFHTTNTFEQAKSSLVQNLYKLNYQPLWGSATHPTTNDIGKGIPYINNKYDFKIGNYLCVWTSHLDYKVVKITNITDKTLLVNITVSWKTADFIIPLVKVMADTSNAAGYLHNLDQAIKYRFRTLT